MTIKITSLFATVTIAGILSMAPFMVNSNQAFAGLSCDEVLIGKQTLQRMFDDPFDCIQVDDKFFTNFRPNPGGFGDVTLSDGSTLPFNAADIDVEGTTVGDEKGLMFTSSSILTFFPGIQPPSPVAIGLGFNYDVFSTGTAIVDNTLTLDIFNVADSILPSALTGVVVQEQVHSDANQQDVIAFKEVFADATPNSDTSEHKEFPPVSFLSVNVDIGAHVNTQSSQNSASIEKFTQTFSQEPEEPPKEPPVGGEFLPIDTTALLVAGAQTNALWILSTLAVIGSIAFGALYLTTRRA